MKATLVLFISVLLYSCGDKVMFEKITAKKQLDSLINYKVNYLHATENKAYFEFTKSIFDKSQISKNCVRPLKEETGGVLYKNKNQEFTNTTKPFLHYDLKRAGESFYRVNVDYYSNSRNLILEEYSLNYELQKTRSFDFIGKAKGEYENISLGQLLYLSNNEFVVTYSTHNYSKPINARLYIGTTNGNSLSAIFDYEFKNQTNCSVLSMVLGSDGNPYILTSHSSKNENVYNLLKFNFSTNIITLEKEFKVNDVSISKIEKLNDNSIILYHDQDYLTNPFVYIFSLKDKEIVKKQIDFDLIGKDFNYAYRIGNYQGEKTLLHLVKNQSRAVIAELTKNQNINPIFEKKEVYSLYYVTDSSENKFILYEVTNSHNNSSKNVNFYRLTSSSDVFKKILFDKHANVNMCYPF